MAVYVDNARNPFGRYLMCHMWADTRDELFTMVDLIGVQRKWFQRPAGSGIAGMNASWEHFDIVQSKRALAIAAGAIETDKYGPSEHVAKLKGDQRALDRIAECRGLGFGGNPWAEARAADRRPCDVSDAAPEGQRAAASDTAREARK